MRCPIDQTELLMTERHGVEIDYCPKCRGVWLDRGELDKIIELATPEVALPNPDPHPDPRPNPVPHPLPPQEAQPPRENWQAERREARYDARRADRYDDRDEDYKRAKRYKKKRRKSLLEELFDVFD